MAQSKKKRLSSKVYPFDHYVDDDHEIVYVYYNSWAGAMGAHTRAKQIWPTYHIRHCTQDLLEYLRGENV